MLAKAMLNQFTLFFDCNKIYKNIVLAQLVWLAYTWNLTQVYPKHFGCTCPATSSISPVTTSKKIVKFRIPISCSDNLQTCKLRYQMKIMAYQIRHDQIEHNITHSQIWQD